MKKNNNVIDLEEYLEKKEELEIENSIDFYSEREDFYNKYELEEEEITSPFDFSNIKL